MASSSYLTGEPWGDRGWNGSSGLGFPWSWHGRGPGTLEPEKHACWAMHLPKTYWFLVGNKGIQPINDPCIIYFRTFPTDNQDVNGSPKLIAS